mmetsp:Transcript_28326/g.32136  ORF Transcript_28326/g.32136 Transcript_28326/m.32136 type:complete len:278 (+) Transcript_28326:589-1422(+)
MVMVALVSEDVIVVVVSVVLEDVVVVVMVAFEEVAAANASFAASLSASVLASVLTSVSVSGTSTITTTFVVVVVVFILPTITFVVVVSVVVLVVELEVSIRSLGFTRTIVVIVLFRRVAGGGGTVPVFVFDADDVSSVLVFVSSVLAIFEFCGCCCAIGETATGCTRTIVVVVLFRMVGTVSVFEVEDVAVASVVVSSAVFCGCCGCRCGSTCCRCGSTSLVLNSSGAGLNSGTDTVLPPPATCSASTLVLPASPSPFSSPYPTQSKGHVLANKCKS